MSSKSRSFKGGANLDAVVRNPAHRAGPPPSDTVDDGVEWEDMIEKGKVTSYWFMAFGIWLVIVGVVTVCVTEINTTAKPLMPYQAVISANLANLGFQFTIYPLDIALCTMAMAIGVLWFIVAWWTPHILAKNYRHSDHWLRLLLNVLLTLAITFALCQFSAITDVFEILVILMLATTVQCFNYMLDQANDRTVPAATLANEAVALTEVSPEGHDESTAALLTNEGFGIEETRYHAHVFAWFSFVLYWIPLMAYLIAAMIVQQAAEAVNACPARLWFTIVLFCAGFLFELAVQILHGAKYWYNSVWLRGIANFDPLTLGLRVLLFSAMILMMIGPAYQIHVLCPV